MITFLNMIKMFAMKPRILFKSEEHRYFDLHFCHKDIQYMCLCLCICVFVCVCAACVGVCECVHVSLSFLLLKPFTLSQRFYEFYSAGIQTDVLQFMNCLNKV
jgi:hypothetical protein